MCCSSMNIVKDRRENPLRCSFHHEKIVHTLVLLVIATLITNLMNGDLKFIRRIEGNVAEFDHVAHLKRDSVISLLIDVLLTRRVEHI